MVGRRGSRVRCETISCWRNWSLQDKYISVQLVASIGAPPHKLLSIIFNWEGSALGPFLHFFLFIYPTQLLGEDREMILTLPRIFPVFGATRGAARPNASSLCLKRIFHLLMTPLLTTYWISNLTLWHLIEISLILKPKLLFVLFIGSRAIRIITNEHLYKGCIKYFS